MFRYIIFLIILNTYYFTFGLPVKQNATKILLANPLTTLAHDCKNTFLVEVIKSNIEHCSIPSDSQSELECLMFYEVSTQLCTEVHLPEIDLREHYIKKINNTEDVEKLCVNAKTWKISNLDKYPTQKRLLEKVFNNMNLCQKLCNVEDIFNMDSNFYCKYFQWGLDLIKSQGKIAQPEIVSVPSQNSFQHKNGSSLLNTEKVVVSKSDSDIKNGEPLPLIPDKPVDKDIPNVMVSGEASTNNQASVSTSTIHRVIDAVDHKNSQQLPAPSIKSEPEKPIAVAEEPPKKENVDNMEPEVPKQGEEIKPLDDNSKVKQNVELDEEADNEFGNDQDPDDDPLADQGVENVNDVIIESDPKLDNEKTKSVEKKIESITSFQDPVQRESGIFPNPIQDSFADDDDHFFPFFLTAIILVVLLYILYHNKTKFTKVILGLIVEGRQTDRRRNSRGHSYRRLDTLEQAMSTNTAAPPSKIIY